MHVIPIQNSHYDQLRLTYIDHCSTHQIQRGYLHYLWIYYKSKRKSLSLFKYLLIVCKRKYFYYNQLWVTILNMSFIYIYDTLYYLNLLTIWKKKYFNCLHLYELRVRSLSLVISMINLFLFLLSFKKNYPFKKKVKKGAKSA